MRRSAKLMTALGVGTAAAATGLLVSCLADPREGEEVTVIDRCDTALLSTDPKSVDSTLRAYYETTGQLLAAVKDADNALKEACADIYKDPELGIAAPPTAATGAGMCQPLLARIAATIGKQPIAPGLATVPPWILIQFDQRCKVPAGSKEACLAACAGPCDLSKCDPDKIVGVCPGECLGTCTTMATPEQIADPDGGIECSGTCIGEIPIPATGGGQSGGTCQGECTGSCANGIYSANCEGTCAEGFTGKCAGTCRGTCNGNPIGPPNDAGGGLELINPEAPRQDPPKPSNDDPGNCGNGICVGSCSDGANGSCFGGKSGGGRCVKYHYTYPDAGLYDYTTEPAGFSMSECFASVCIGTCTSANGSGAAISIGSPPTTYPGRCRGECTQLTKPTNPQLPTNTTCTGICRPKPDSDPDAGAQAFCSTDLDPASRICEGALNCGQNVECSNACEAKAALDAVCEDAVALQIYSVTDPALHKALKANGKKLAQAVAKLKKAQTAYSFIGNRNYGDFVALGAKGDLAYACATEGAKNMAAANEILGPASAADPTAVRYVK